MKFNVDLGKYWLYRFIFIEKRLRMKGAILLPYLLLKNKGKTIIVNWIHIGDTCYTMAYIRQFISENRIKNIVIPSKGYSKKIIEKYKIPEVEIFDIKDEEFVFAITMFLEGRIGKAIARRLRRRNLLIDLMYEYDIRDNLELYKLKTINWLDLIRYCSFELKEDKKPEYPPIEDIDIMPIVKKYGLPEGKTVILNPVGVTMKFNNYDFWESLSIALKKKGYCVVTSLAGEQKPVKGTIGIKTTLDESYHLLEYCGYGIGIRSGWFDYIVSANAKLICLYYQENDYFRLHNVWSLKGWQTDNCVEFNTDFLNDEALIKDIISSLNEN